MLQDSQAGTLYIAQLEMADLPAFTIKSAWPVAVRLFFSVIALTCACAIAPAYAHGGGESASERIEDRSDSGDREVREIEDRSDNSGSGSDRADSGDREDKSGRDVETREREDNSGHGNAEDRSGGHSSDDRGRMEAAGADDRHRPQFDIDIAIERNERGERIRSSEVVLISARKDIAARVKALGFKVIETRALTSVGLRLVRVAVPNERKESDVIQALHAADPKGTAAFNHIYEPSGGTIVLAVAASSAHKASRTKAKVGLIDAGVDTRHHMLKDVIVKVHQFGKAGTQGTVHGTAVASRLAGAAPGATIYAADVFNELSGDEIATVDAIVGALDWQAKMKVPVINLSLAGPANPALEAITKRLIMKGFVLVAAVGNEGPNGPPQYPAAYNGVIGVTAVDASNDVYRYANRGNYVDFAAFGVEAPAADHPDGEIKVSGTSYAAPVVAAAIARLMRSPTPLDAQKAIAALKRRARDLGAPGRDTTFGDGLIEIKE